MPPSEVLGRALSEVGLVDDEVELIRDGSNTLYTVGTDVVARIGPAGSAASARQLLNVAGWLHDTGLPVVSAVQDLRQPIVIDGHPVTWWRRLPPHRHATPAELGATLRELHRRRPPATPVLPELDPFAGLENTIATLDASGDRELIEPTDQAWLHDCLDRCRDEYALLRPRLDTSVVHGDAWQGNVVVPYQHGGPPILLDLDQVSTGPRDWDLVPLAADYTDFARIGKDDYEEFVAALGGYDVTNSPAFDVMSLLVELKWTTFAIRQARRDPSIAEEVRHRIACLRGDVPKPWVWNAQ